MIKVTPVLEGLDKPWDMMSILTANVFKAGKGIQWRLRSGGKVSNIYK